MFSAKAAVALIYRRETTQIFSRSAPLVPLVRKFSSSLFSNKNVRIQDKDFGKSLKAARGIERGATIAAEWVEGESVVLKPSRYSLRKGDGIHLDVKSKIRYTNHSFTPNASVRFPSPALEDRKAHLVALVAISSITEGSEITIDYTSTEVDLADPFIDVDTGRLVA